MFSCFAVIQYPNRWTYVSTNLFFLFFSALEIPPKVFFEFILSLGLRPRLRQKTLLYHRITSLFPLLLLLGSSSTKKKCILISLLKIRAWDQRSINLHLSPLSILPFFSARKNKSKEDCLCVWLCTNKLVTHRPRRFSSRLFLASKAVGRVHSRSAVSKSLVQPKLKDFLAETRAKQEAAQAAWAGLEQQQAWIC